MTNRRLTSLDVFRGITIAGMILVNKAGVADEMYPMLEHANWNGWTPADLIFPFFLFIIGVAMAFSFTKYTGEGKGDQRGLYMRILRRCAVLFALGLLINGFYTYNFTTIRIMGVLQRIAVAYFLSAVIILNFSRKQQGFLACLILIGYWLAMNYVPVPGYGAGALSREGNLGAYVDRLLIGKTHLYQGDHYHSMGDPEGLFSTLPCVVTILIGYWTGVWLRNQQIQSRTSVKMALFAIGSLVLGQLWHFWFPINKKIWTSSYVVFTAGWALLFLALCYELIEVRRHSRWGKPFELLGLNAIFLFVASVLLIKILVKTNIDGVTTYQWIHSHVFAPWFDDVNGSLFFAIATLLLWWAVAYGMYRQRWFFKV